MSQDVELKRLLEAAKPEDVPLHIKLLDCYLNLKWIRYAYCYAIQVLEQHVFDDNIDWYIWLKKLFKLYEDNEEYVKDGKFYMHYMRVMERFMYLLLRGEQLFVSIEGSMKDIVEALFSFGEVVQRSSELTASSCDPVLFHKVLQEMKSKFCCHLSTVVTAKQKYLRQTRHMHKRQPKSLQRFALHMVGIVIAKSVLDIFINVRRMQPDDFTDEKRRHLESLIMRASEFFDSVVPKTLHRTVMLNSLKCLPDYVWEFVDSCEIKLNYLDIILRSQKHITDFTVYDNYVPSIESVSYSCLHRLKNLENLCLYSWDLRKNFYYVTKVTRAIKDMKSLASFESIYCNDQIVKVLGNNNYALKKLKLSDNTDVTDSSVPYILNLKNLRELDIYYCYISTESQIQLLSGLPHLKAIAVRKLNQFLAQMNDDSEQLPYQSVRYYCDTVEDIVNLTKYCPLITHLTLETNSKSLDALAFCDITSLAALSRLKIFHCGISLNYSDLKPFLELKGHDLIELSAHLMDVSSVTETENEINHLYPNLKEVTIYDWISFN